MIIIGSMAVVMKAAINIRWSNVNTRATSHISIPVVYGYIFTSVYIDIISIADPVSISCITSVNISGGVGFTSGTSISSSAFNIRGLSSCTWRFTYRP